MGSACAGPSWLSFPKFKSVALLRTGPKKVLRRKQDKPVTETVQKVNVPPSHRPEECFLLICLSDFSWR